MNDSVFCSAHISYYFQRAEVAYMHFLKRRDGQLQFQLVLGMKECIDLL